MIINYSCKFMNGAYDIDIEKFYVFLIIIKLHLLKRLHTTPFH